jgi:hypothetical protein
MNHRIPPLILEFGYYTQFAPLWDVSSMTTIENQSLRLARLDQFLNLRGALAND